MLSHLAGVEHGSHGELVDGLITLNDSDRAGMKAGEPLILRLAVPDDAPHAGGLCIFGADTGELPLDPTLDIHTRDPLPEDLGVGLDTPAARRRGREPGVRPPRRVASSRAADAASNLICCSRGRPSGRGGQDSGLRSLRRTPPGLTAMGLSQ